MRSLLAAVLLTALALPAVRADQAAPASVKPMEVLQAMVKAYREVRSLQQETTYEVKGPGLSDLIDAKLIMERPNRLLLELHKYVPRHIQPVLIRVVCDGRNSYTYREEMRQYTKTKAPRDLKGFQMLSYSVEMAALTGADPFENIKKQAPPMSMDEPAVVDGVMNDVVKVDTSTPERMSVMRFYIGQQDHLLRRFAFETQVTARPDSPAPSKPAEPLSPEETPLDPAPASNPVYRYSYDNRVQVNPKLARELFKWQAPAGAFLYDPMNSLFDTQNALGDVQDPNYVKPNPRTIKPPKPIKIVPLKDFRPLPRK